MTKNVDAITVQMTAAHAAWLLKTPGKSTEALDVISDLMTWGKLSESAWSWGADRIGRHLRAMVYGVA